MKLLVVNTKNLKSSVSCAPVFALLLLFVCVFATQHRKEHSTFGLVC